MWKDKYEAQKAQWVAGKVKRWIGMAIVVILLFPSVTYAVSQRGKVLANHLPVPGARVVATQGTKNLDTVTNAQGNYVFTDLSSGEWIITVTMRGFAIAEQKVTVTEGTPAAEFELKMLPLEAMQAQAAITSTVAPASEQPQASAEDIRESPTAPAQKPGQHPEQKKDKTETKNVAPASSVPATDDGLLLNGSMNNGANSPFSFLQAFGNSRQSRRVYNGGFGVIYGSSALDARPYSLTGLDASQPSYNQVTMVASFGGPLYIPHVPIRKTNFSVNYQWTRNSNAQLLAGLMPTVEQRTGTIPHIDSVAEALLAFYPLPNVSGNTSYNYQAPVLNGQHADAMQARVQKYSSRTGNFSGRFSFQNTRSDTTNLFRFRDAGRDLGINSEVTWSRYFHNGLNVELSENYSRQRTNMVPYFANRFNVSGYAGMTGNLQDAPNWGPPTLVFSSGIASLTDGQSARNRNQTNTINVTVEKYARRHNIKVGGDLKRLEFNYFAQQNPRGTFAFTGNALGSDFADFLSGVPDTAEIVYGNADKYLRQWGYDLFATNDWRVNTGLTLNLGVRWEYSAPMTELKKRLANLDVQGDFAQVATVTAQQPISSLTGKHYSSALLNPDRTHIEPRIGFAWRPVAGDSIVVRGGYGIYADTSVYQNIALQMAQQAPFSTSISASNAICTQSLKTGPNACSGVTTNTFGIDPDFRTGFAQVWQLSVQRDLPAALQGILTYSGIQGSNGVQQFFPNTYVPGAVNPCPGCPTGFAYRISNGSSSRHASIAQIRRRLRSGLSASLQYTWSKSIDDDAALGGQGPASTGSAIQNVATAQNWRDLGAERGLSSFDQRHLLNATVQYTTGMGLGGGTLLRGWLGRAYKEWTLLNNISFGSGLPETPVYMAVVGGTGFTGSLRPDRTSAALYEQLNGRYLNPAAYVAPALGQWGNAGRNSITGPRQFSWNTSLLRTFRPKSDMSLDIRADATNILNHATFSSYNVTVNPEDASPLFGLPSSANTMRNLRLTARWRF